MRLLLRFYITIVAMPHLPLMMEYLLFCYILLSPKLLVLRKIIQTYVGPHISEVTTWLDDIPPEKKYIRVASKYVPWTVKTMLQQAIVGDTRHPGCIRTISGLMQRG